MSGVLLGFTLHVLRDVPEGELAKEAVEDMVDART